MVQDALADLVRIMLVRCYDEKNHKALYDHVRGLRGQAPEWYGNETSIFPNNRTRHDC